MTGENITVRHPGADRAVLACACGQVLDARDMVRIRPMSQEKFHHTESTTIYPIGCRACAVARRPHPRAPRWSD